MSGKRVEVQFFYRLETSLHRAEIRTSPSEVSELLADDFLEFGRSGRVYDKRITVEALAAEISPGSAPQVTDFSVRQLASDVVLVTYTSTSPETGTQKKRATLRSSLWKRDAGRWQMVFHQGTPVPHD